MMEQRNLLIALVLSLAIITAFHYLYTVPQLERKEAAQQRVAEQQAATGETEAGAAPDRPRVPEAGETGVVRPTVPSDAPGAAVSGARQAVLAETPRVPIIAPRLDGSISLLGGILDDLTLIDYHETIAPDSPAIELLSPAHTPEAYFVELGWQSSGQDIVLPDKDTLWQADGRTLTPETPLSLRWENGAGLAFRRTFTVDENYLFTVTQSVENRSGARVELFPYGLIYRWGTPEITGFYILHEGPLGVLDGTLEELDYDDLQDDGPVEQDSTGGWIGITDKYWLVALVPERALPIRATFRHTLDNATDKYQADYIALGAKVLLPGQTLSVTTDLFAGAKEVTLLEHYAETLEIEKLDRAVVFRWLYFLAEPLFKMLIYFNGILGNFGLAILVLTVLIKIVFFPLANKSYRAMGRMKKLTPQMTELRERHKDDKQKLNQEMMALYKREKINPMAGCWPMLIQIPVFFCLYEVLFVTIEMRHAPFYGWIQDLSAPDPTSFVNLFGLLPFQPPDALLIGAWPLIMGLSMFLMQKLNPQPADAMQARIFMFLPIIFTFILARFPSGLVIYWAWNNILSIAQQWIIMRRAMAGGRT